MANVEDAAVDGNTFSHLQGLLLEVAGLSHEYGVPEVMPAASPYNPSQPSHTQVHVYSTSIYPDENVKTKFKVIHPSAIVSDMYSLKGYSEMRTPL